MKNQQKFFCESAKTIHYLAEILTFANVMCTTEALVITVIFCARRTVKKSNTSITKKYHFVIFL